VSSRALQLTFVAALVAVAGMLPAAPGGGTSTNAAPGAPKTRPLLSYTEFGTFFCEAKGAVDLAIYHDGTVLSMLKSPCSEAFRRDSTTVYEYHFSQKRIRGILRRLKQFGIFDTPSHGHEMPTDGNVVLLDAWFEGRRAVSPNVYRPDEAEPVGRANVFLSRLIAQLPRGAPVYEPHGYVVKVTRQGRPWRYNTAWPERERADLWDYLGEHVVPVDTGEVFAGVFAGFDYDLFRQDLRLDCHERACKRAFSVYWRPLWPHEPGPE